jgi:hypothetical protein
VSLDTLGREFAVQERRKIVRSRVLKGAKIVLGNSSLIDCTVRNVTSAGARVQIANTVELPNGLGLTFDGGHSIRPCKVIWRSVTETGVEFTG